MRSRATADEVLHEASVETLERRIVELALERTGAVNGGIFLWDPKLKGLTIDFQLVDRRVVPIPHAVLRSRPGQRNGIALWSFEHDEPYVCHDSEHDPHYARYFLDVRSIAAVPIRWQGRPIGVLSVSAMRTHAFEPEHVAELEALAGSSAKFLRRAQLFRASRERGGRPMLIKGMSPEWLVVERKIEQISPTDAPVLIHGESGTGKELVAHAIHFNSKRASEAFVIVNCAAIPETMLESILFGHVRGAFTGASYDKVGELQKADKGTLFLDEIGELPIGLQAKVLRATESGEIQPLGSNEPPRHVDVRLICATHRDLTAMVRAGQFRDDLYYRLSVMPIELPALRTYGADNLDVLTEVFLQQTAQRHGRPTPRLSPDAAAMLAGYHFPGNVRELKNILEHAFIMCSRDEIGVADLPFTVRVRSPSRAVPGPPAPPAPPAPADPDAIDRPLRELRERWLAAPEARYLEALLIACRGNVRAAARRAGVDAVTLYRLLKKRGIAVRRDVTRVGGAGELG
jgi:DNA-binding NtrC family response regulator